MKANTLKRAVALALAVLILLGTLGYFLSTVAYGAITEFEASYKIVKKDNALDETTKVVFLKKMALML